MQTISISIEVADKSLTYITGTIEDAIHFLEKIKKDGDYND